MKKILSIVLVLVMVLGLCACAGGQGASKSGLQIGYAKEKIMPETSVPLGGYGETSQRMSQNFLDYLYSTCIAATEGEETVLIYTVDLLLPPVAWVNEAREKITAEYGIPGDHVSVSFTHTHSGPDIYSSEPSIQQYKTKWIEAMVKAAGDALNDRAPAELYGVKTETEGLSFIRHYLLKNGSVGGDAHLDFSATDIVDHQAEVDPEMLLVKAEREGDKADVLIMNWAAHPCFTGSATSPNISADFIGSTRDVIEKETGMLFAYFTAAAGNVNGTSRIEGEDKNLDYKEMGQAVADVAIAALPNMQKLEGSGVRAYQVKEEYAYNHDDEELYSEAKKVMSMWETQGLAVARAYAQSHGMTSTHHARAITERVTRGASGKMELNAMRIGGFALVAAPYEMFAATGSYIKENSPFEMTMVFSCSNQYGAYVPTQEAYDYTCYESVTSLYTAGTAEASSAKLVEMLKTLV